MRDWNGDGFPDPVPDWHSDGLGCSGCIWLIVLLGVLAAGIYLVLNA